MESDSESRRLRLSVRAADTSQMWFSNKHQKRGARIAAGAAILGAGSILLSGAVTAAQRGHADRLWGLLLPLCLLVTTGWWLLVRVPRQGVGIEREEVAVVNSFRTRRFPIDAVERFGFDPDLSVAYLVQTSGERVYTWGLQQAKVGHRPGQAEVLVADINTVLDARRSSAT